jgi:hypothetical protein
MCPDEWLTVTFARQESAAEHSETLSAQVDHGLTRSPRPTWCSSLRTLGGGIVDHLPGFARDLGRF